MLSKIFGCIISLNTLQTIGIPDISGLCARGKLSYEKELLGDGKGEKDWKDNKDLSLSVSAYWFTVLSPDYPDWQWFSRCQAVVFHSLTAMQDPSLVNLWAVYSAVSMSYFRR